MRPVDEDLWHNNKQRACAYNEDKEIYEPLFQGNGKSSSLEAVEGWNIIFKIE